MLHMTSNCSSEKTKLNEYRHSSMKERLNQGQIAQIKQLVNDADIVSELAKKHSIGWASISQLSLMQQQQMLAGQLTGRSTDGKSNADL